MVEVDVSKLAAAGARERHRLVSDEMLEKAIELREQGNYTYASLADALGLGRDRGGLLREYIVRHNKRLAKKKEAQ